MVVVAQLVEHWVVVPDVAGSSPVDHPTQIIKQSDWENQNLKKFNYLITKFAQFCVIKNQFKSKIQPYL